MQLFYAPDIMPPLYALGEEESKHCVRVLRLRRGGRIHITDGRGNLFCCEITDDDPKRCTVRIVSVEEGVRKNALCADSGRRADQKPRPFQWLLEKATEVGVTEFLPLDTAHSERHVFKPARGEKVITAALKQSLKAYRPALLPLTPFREAVLRPFEGRRSHRPLRPGPVARRQGLPPRRAPPGRDGRGLHRARGGFLTRGDRLRPRPRGSRRSPRHPASAHRNGGPRGRGHGLGRKLA